MRNFQNSIFIWTQLYGEIFKSTSVYLSAFKGTLMQIENLPICSCSYKNIYPEYFAFLILRVFELFTRKVCKMFVYKHTETIDYVKK